MSKVSAHSPPTSAYAGDVTAQQAWSVLASDPDPDPDPDAVLVDVRTQIEWTLIGKPDLSQMSREPVYLQWVTMQGPNPNFVSELQAALEARPTGSSGSLGLRLRPASSAGARSRSSPASRTRR